MQNVYVYNCVQCYNRIQYKLIYKTCTGKLSVRLSTTPRPEAPRVLCTSALCTVGVFHTVIPLRLEEGSTVSRSGEVCGPRAQSVVRR